MRQRPAACSISCQTTGVFQVSDSAPSLRFLGGCQGAGLVAGPQASPLRSSSSPQAVREVPAPGARKEPASLCFSRPIWRLSLLPGHGERLGWDELLGGGCSGCSARPPLQGQELAARLSGKGKGCCLLGRAQGLPVQAELFCGSAGVLVCLLCSETAGKGSLMPCGGLWGWMGRDGGTSGL